MLHLQCGSQDLPAKKAVLTPVEKTLLCALQTVSVGIARSAGTGSTQVTSRCTQEPRGPPQAITEVHPDSIHYSTQSRIHLKPTRQPSVYKCY